MVYWFLWVFFLDRAFSNDSCSPFFFLHNPSLLFIALFLGSRGTIDSLVLPPEYQSPFCAHRPEGWVFPVSHFFLPFGAVFSKAHGWLSISECTGFWCHVPYGSAFGRPSSLSFFSNGRNPTLPVWKSFAATPFFIALHSDSPRYRPLALWEVTPDFLLFLAGSLVPEKDVSILCFLCSFDFSFELS